MTYERRNKGTCSVMTKVELNPDHTIESVEVLGGCNGNLKGICQLVTGMKAEDVAKAIADLADSGFITGQVLGVSGGFVIT